MSKRTRTHSPATLDALATLGHLIAAARREQRLSVADTCERLGITPNTLRKVERGAPTVAVGVVFELATILGVPLFDVAPGPELAALRVTAATRLALIPQRVRQRGAVDDDF